MINENEIIFNNSINTLPLNKLQKIQRYCYENNIK